MANKKETVQCLYWRFMYFLMSRTLATAAQGAEAIGIPEAVVARPVCGDCPVRNCRVNVSLSNASLYSGPTGVHVGATLKMNGEPCQEKWRF